MFDFTSIINLPLLTDEKFIANSPFWWRLLYMIFSMHIARYKFYFAWKLGECSQILSGLGYDFDTHHWNAIDNMDIIRFEVFS